MKRWEQSARGVAAAPCVGPGALAACWCGAKAQAACSTVPVCAMQAPCQTSWRTKVGRKLDWGKLFPFWYTVLGKLLISAWSV